MKIIKNRFVITGVCLFVAAIIAFVVLPGLYNDRQATVTVYRATDYIPRGEQITAKHITAVDVGAFNLPGSVVTDPAEIIGQYALTDIPKDDLILSAKTGDYLISDMLDALMRQGKRLVTITLPSIAAGVSGHLESGDTVSVVCFIEAHDTFVTDDKTGFDIRVSVPAETIMYPELRNLSVYDVENAKTESVEYVREQEGNSLDPVPKTVTLIVTDEQALKLVEAEYAGKIHLVFERRNK